MTRTMSFLICGAQKSGTSALHQYLRGHPDIDLPAIKELHIFDNELSDWSDQGIARIDSKSVIPGDEMKVFDEVMTSKIDMQI